MHKLYLKEITNKESVTYWNKTEILSQVKKPYAIQMYPISHKYFSVFVINDNVKTLSEVDTQ